MAFSAEENAAIRETLLREARRCAVTLGLRKTSVEQLTEAAGISKGLFYKYFASKELLFFEVLEDIQDPGNLGTMLRTGEGAGITAVIMSKKTADLFNPKTIRSTMGSVYRVPFCYVEDLKAVIEKMHAAGIQTYAAHLQGKNSYTQECYSAKTAFLIGNEGNGLSDEIAALAMCKIRIPMEGQVESLNAAVSAAILMYEAKRQNN